VRNLLRLQRQMPAELRLAWRHRPLSEHEHARVAADFAATLQQGAGDDAFWRFLGQVAAAEQPPAVPALRAWLEHSGIEGTQWQKWLASPAASEHVARDLRLAGQFNVRSTPTSFVNGLRVDGSKPYAELRQLVERERRAAVATLASGTEPHKLYLIRTKKNLINLGPDVVLRACPKIGKSPARGAKDALVTIVEFADFECEYCKRAQPTLRALLARYPQTLRLVWKNFPLEQHARAKPAAALAMEVYEQRGERQFWQLHDVLFKAAPDLSEPALLNIARAATLSAEDAEKTLRRAEQASAVLRDVALGEKLAVSGTPTFFVNGRRIAGARPQREFHALIDEELKVAGRLIKSGTARDAVYRTLCGNP
jgi:protein-disulfide isomerase